MEVKEHPHSATYSPEDNKLRLYPAYRLDKHEYDRVKEAGFRWAPRQELFVAPMWTPDREDLLFELCGEIGDEDTGLVERAEERADRFGDYSHKRAADADAAKRAVSSIADGIPLGQPILVGHHSERRARKDAERIENGMRKAVKMWQTSEYWKDRAAGAIRHARYKERPDVRARRIKKIEAEIRKCKARFTPADNSRIMQTPWNCPVCHKYACDEHPEAKEKVLHAWCAPRGGRGGSWVPVADLPALEKYYSRWIAHHENRLVYERAMLGEQGGTIADKVGLEKGGACRCWASPRGGWSKIVRVNKVTVSVLDNWGNDGPDFKRNIDKTKLGAVMTKAEVDAAREAGRVQGETERGFFLAEPTADQPPKPKPTQEPNDFQKMQDSLRQGVKTVSAPQLFATPPEIAARMVELAEIDTGDRVLEPSAGTGRLIEAIRTAAPAAQIVPVEINRTLVDGLARKFSDQPVYTCCGDFLEYNGELGTFDRVVMNPPFANGVDIKHIEKALDMLKPGGRLVALCANGPRQQAAFKERAEHWEALPAGSFKDAGTNVNVALLVLVKD
jgi:protein-L-isoaspartate O-methyltransferase